MILSDSITSRKVKALPSRDKGESLGRKLGKIRDHKRKWSVPADAELVLALHFSVYSFQAGLYHADATLEIPVEDGFIYTSVTSEAKNRYDALICLIERIQDSNWFHHMKKRGVYFKITGELERLYRGYL